MKIQYSILLTFGLLLGACGEKKSSVQQKREALEKIKRQITALQNEAKKLEGEIAILEPVKEKSKLVETETRNHHCCCF
ncbi:MAG: hypothetical protein RIT07_1259 [Bacteroidota bacterium]